MGVDGCWCAPWSSKPVMGVNSLLGGFDSHIFPPDKKPRNHCDCGAFFAFATGFRLFYG